MKKATLKYCSIT